MYLAYLSLKREMVKVKYALFFTLILYSAKSETKQELHEVRKFPSGIFRKGSYCLNVQIVANDLIPFRTGKFFGSDLALSQDNESI